MRSTARNLIAIFLLIFGLSSTGYADSSGTAQSCAIATHEVALEGGVLYYNEVGQGPAVVLLHGLFAQKEQWNALLCELSAAGYTAIAPDLPGYGKSTDFPLADYQLEQQAERLRQWLDALGIYSVDLAGSSMGGAIAALYVQRYPQSVRTLAFIGSPLGVVEWSPTVKAAIYQGINPFIPVDIAQFDLEMRLLLVNPPVIPDAVKAALVKEYVERNRHYQQVWNIVNLYDTLLYHRRHIRVPTLILWGESDQIFTIAGIEQLHSRIPRSQRVILPNVGHLPMLENPIETAAYYVHFLKTGYRGY
jgi:pimeloyl-ACP methyl ester carboxylesterase